MRMYNLQDVADVEPPYSMLILLSYGPINILVHKCIEKVFIYIDIFPKKTKIISPQNLYRCEIRLLCSQENAYKHDIVLLLYITRYMKII